MRRASQRHQAGFVLLIGLTVTSIVLTLASAGLTRSLTELRVANRSLAGYQAFHLAEAGVDVALNEFASGGSFSEWTQPDLTPCVPGPGRPCTWTKPIANGVATVTVSDTGSNAALIQIDATGQTEAGLGGSVERRLHAEGTSRVPAFQFAAFGADYLEFGTQESVTFDSYDSALGPYTLGSAYSAGNIGTNDDPGGSDQDVDVKFLNQPSESDYATIQGNLYLTSGATTNPSSIPSTLLTGSVISMSQPFALPDFTIPKELTGTGCEPVPDLTVGQSSNTTESRTLLAGRTYCSDANFIVDYSGTLVIEDNVKLRVRALQLKDHATVLVGDNVSFYFTGQQDGAGNPYVFTLNTNYSQMQTGRNTRIYAEPGYFWMMAKDDTRPTGIINTTQNPADLQIRLKGNTSTYASRWTNGNWLEQTPPFYGAVYIQQGFLWVKGGLAAGGGWSAAEHYGSIVSGDDLRFGTHTEGNWLKFHYDEALRNISLDGSSKFKLLLWREQ